MTNLTLPNNKIQNEGEIVVDTNIGGVPPLSVTNCTIEPMF